MTLKVIGASARELCQYRDIDPATHEWVQGLKDNADQSPVLG
jgi:hypothetical protein